MRIRDRVRAEDGVTVLEVLVAMAVLGIFFGTFATVVGSTIKHGSQIQEEAVSQTEARAAVDTLAADLRQATTAGDASLTRISTATGTQLTFLSPDRAQPMHLRRISYQVSAGKLQRAIATSTNTVAPWSIPALSGWSTLANGLVTTAIPVFSYFDAFGTATGVLANIRTIRIRVTVATALEPARQLSYDTRVSLRSDA